MPRRYDYDREISRPRSDATGDTPTHRSIAMTVRAKFRCTSITPYKHQRPDGTEGRGATISLTAVFARNPDGTGQCCEENKLFGQWTPSGTLSMSIVNEAAVDQFELGAEYYLDVSRADPTPLRDFPHMQGDTP